MAENAARCSQHDTKAVSIKVWILFQTNISNHFVFYWQNANLVLPTDTSLNDRRERNESTGEVLSLTEHLKSIRMGDRAQHTQPEPSKKFVIYYCFSFYFYFLFI
jgi:hypothetical protein